MPDEKDSHDAIVQIMADRRRPRVPYGVRADRRLLTGVFLLCFANMVLEIVVTRLFSATMFYHFTFLAVALALFGIAASGVYVFIAGDRLSADLRGEMAKSTRRFALGALLAVAYAMANPIDVLIVTGSNAIPAFTSRQVWQLIFLVGITAIPRPSIAM